MFPQNLANIDDLISSSLNNLETEDIIYLEEYLVGEDFGSHSPSLWSALKENSEGDASASPEARQEGVHTDQSDKHIDDEDSEDVDEPHVLPDTPRLEE